MLERLGIGGLGAAPHPRSLRRAAAAHLPGPRPDRRAALLVLDEPTASVDVKTRDDILHLLAELNRQGVTIVMTTHELNAVAAHLPWVVCVNGGDRGAGPPVDVFTAPILSRTFDAEMRVVRDAETGGLLVAEAGSHGPFGARRRQRGSAADARADDECPTESRHGAHRLHAPADCRLPAAADSRDAAL